MSDNTESFNLDIDLESVKTPFAVVPEGEFTLQLKDIELTQSKTGRPMLKCQYITNHPDTNEVVTIRDYPLLDKQDGKFRLRQILTGAGQPLGDWQNSLASCIGTQYQGEVSQQEDEQYGTQNQIRRLLVQI